MAAPAEGVTFSSWARSPQPEWPYKLVEPDTAPKLTPTSVTARIAIVDALYAQAKPADDPRLPIPTPAKKKRPGGPSPRSRGAHRPATRARRVAANAAQASPRPPPQALTLRECVVLDRAEGRDACDIVDEFTATLFAGGGADRARSALSRACARDAPEDVVRRMVRQALERLRKLRPAGLPMGSESKASATTGLVVGEAFQAVYGLREGLSRDRHAAAFAHMVESNGLEAVVEDFLALTPMGARLLRRAGAAPAPPRAAPPKAAPKPEAARLSAAFAPPSSPPRNAARARAASPAVAEDYCAPCEAPAPEAAGRPHAWAKSCYVPMPTEYLHDCELGCGATYRLQKKAQHLGEECPKRLVLCKDCGERYVFENAKAHRDLECKSTASRWRNRATKSRLRAETRRITALLASQKRASNPAKAAAAAAAAAVVEEDDEEVEAEAAAEATAGAAAPPAGEAPATATAAETAATAAATAAETPATAAETPPAEQPPADQPPAEQPPAEQPPANQLPAEQPPAEQPPAPTPPPAAEPPATTETPAPPPAAGEAPAAADAPPPAVAAADEAPPAARDAEPAAARGAAPDEAAPAEAVGAMAAGLCSLARPRTADRPLTADSVSSEPRMLEIAGANGAIVRARPDLNSDVVGELDQGTPVFYTGTRTHITDRAVGERVRIEIDAPLEGWVSLALCGPCDAAPSGGIP